MTKNMAIDLLNKGELFLNDLPIELKNDREVVLIALRNGSVMYDVPSIFSKDRALILEAVEKFIPGVEEFIHEELYADKLFLTELHQRGLDFNKTNITLSESDFLQFLKNKGSTLEYDTLEDDNIIAFLKSSKIDRKFIKKIVEVNGLALKYFDTSLRDDKEIIEISIKQNPRSLSELNSSRE